MSSIEYFLKRQIYGPDDETIHCGLLQTLMEDCPEFTKHLLNVPLMPINVKVILKPDNGIFDILVTVDGQPYYLEVKIWANFSEEQFSRQLEYIKAKKGQGCFVLFTKAAAKWSPEIVSERSNSCCRVISRSDLQTALDAVDTFSSSEIAEIAKAYKSVLQDIQKRNSQRVDCDRALIKSYFGEQKIRKLHIGCGRNILGGWLNSDFPSNSDRVLNLDATKPFPFTKETFDYIFSEHIIEHLSYSNGLEMLMECYRVLKNNGKIRISTPDLQFLVDLYSDKKSELQKEYIKWATDSFIENAPYYDDTFVINNFVRDWGHLFIYNEKTLRSSFEKAGFTKILRCELNESQDELLRNLENEKRLPKGFLKLESVILEGTKVIDG